MLEKLAVRSWWCRSKANQIFATTNAPFGPSTGLSSSGGASGGASGGSVTGPASAGGSAGGATGAGAARKGGASTCHGHGYSPPFVSAGATVELNQRKIGGVA